MPRTRRGIGPAAGGVRVDGIYADLLRREREFYYQHGEPFVTEDGREIRVWWKDRDDHSAGCFVNNRHLLDALEAGEAVTVAAWQLSSRRVQVPESLRPGNCPGSWWRVSADDVVQRANSPVVDRPPRTGRHGFRTYVEDGDDGISE